MSYCQLIPFTNGEPYHGMEFRNAWGGAARIWDSLFGRYLKNPAIPYHTWLGGGDELWSLAKRAYLPLFERAVHGFTFDRAYVRRENFVWLATDLRSFASRYPVEGVDHLCEWAAAIESLDAEAVGCYGTSVAENPWFEWDDEKEESVGRKLSDGFEVYDWLAELE